MPVQVRYCNTARRSGRFAALFIAAALDDPAIGGAKLVTGNAAAVGLAAIRLAARLLVLFGHGETSDGPRARSCLALPVMPVVPVNG